MLAISSTWLTSTPAHKPEIADTFPLLRLCPLQYVGITSGFTQPGLNICRLGIHERGYKLGGGFKLAKGATILQRVDFKEGASDRDWTTIPTGRSLTR